MTTTHPDPLHPDEHELTLTRAELPIARQVLLEAGACILGHRAAGETVTLRVLLRPAE